MSKNNNSRDAAAGERAHGSETTAEPTRGSNGGSRTTTRRQFAGGLASLFAASAFSLSVAEDTAAQVTAGDDGATQTVTSPEGTVELTVDVADGTPTYSVVHDGSTIVDGATLGFEFQN